MPLSSFSLSLCVCVCAVCHVPCVYIFQFLLAIDSAPRSTCFPAMCLKICWPLALNRPRRALSFTHSFWTCSLPRRKTRGALGRAVVCVCVCVHVRVCFVAIFFFLFVMLCATHYLFELLTDRFVVFLLIARALQAPTKSCDSTGPITRWP